LNSKAKSAASWYLWVTRSASVAYFVLDGSRSAAVPGAHFAGLQHPQVIIVCGRYSAYKKLARLSQGTILLAFCWAHVRRDFLDAGRGYSALQTWALAIKFVTPAQRHSGQDQAILAKRHAVYIEAKRRNPQRWSGRTRDWTHLHEVHLNPEKPTEPQSTPMALAA
jgi:hypothetical protein